MARIVAEAPRSRERDDAAGWYRRVASPPVPPMSTTDPVLTDALRARLRERVERAIPSLHGWTTVDKGARMAEIVVEARSARSVELGVFGGRGTIALAIGHEAIGVGEVLAIDPWEKAASLEGVNAPENDEWWAKLDYEAIYASCVHAMRDAGVDRWCRVLRERSADAVRRVTDGSVAVLHQDSNHSEAVSCAEVEQWVPKLRRDGWWIADDTDWATTQKAQARLVELGFAVVEDHANWRVYRRR